MPGFRAAGSRVWGFPPPNSCLPEEQGAIRRDRARPFADPGPSGEILTGGRALYAAGAHGPTTE